MIIIVKAGLLKEFVGHITGTSFMGTQVAVFIPVLERLERLLPEYVHLTLAPSEYKEVK
jgi:hypothetical protein